MRCDALAASFVVHVDACLPTGFAAIGVGLGGVGDELPADDVSFSADPDYVPPTPADADVIARG